MDFRNHVYQLSKSTLSPHNTIEWSTPAQVAEECLMKGRKDGDCHNFIRVVAKRRNGHLLVCGTHAFSPQCREYEFLRSENRYKSQRDFNGRAISPYDPRANFTYVYSPESNEIFVATVSDFNGNDPLIYKKKIPTGDGLRTQKDDLRVLDRKFQASFEFAVTLSCFRSRLRWFLRLQRFLLCLVSRTCIRILRRTNFLTRGPSLSKRQRWTLHDSGSMVFIS